MAGAALCATGSTFAWQAQHFDCLGLAGARLVAGGTARICVAGAALCAASATFVWQVQHFDCLGLAGERRCVSVCEMCCVRYVCKR